MSSRSLGYQQITSLSTATALTVPAGTAFALINAQTQAVRWRDDGTDPTASVGYPLAAGSEIQYNSASLSRLKFIEQVASATLNIVYYSGD